MANGNKGIGSYLPFPTFGGEKSPGIMPVQLQPSPMKFPTSNYNPSRAPADVNPLSAFAPLLLSGIASKLFAEEPMTAPEPEDVDLEKAYSQEDIRKRVDDPERAEYMAEQIFGPRGKLSGAKKWGRLALENLPALFFEDPRELSAYMDTSAAIRKARTDADLSREEFIGDYRANMAAKVLNSTPAFDAEGTGVSRRAIEGPNGGFYIMSMGNDEDRTVGGALVAAGDFYQSPKWIPGEPVRDPSVLRASRTDIENSFRDKRDELETVAASLKTSQPLVSDVIRTTLENPEITTWWDPLIRFKNAGEAFIGAYNKDRKPEIHLADDKTRNTWFDQTTGKPTQKFLELGVLPYVTEVMGADGKFKTVTQQFNFNKTFGDAGNQAEFRSIMINLAYLAAAANGQTGRTLSDKDLALHLEQLGATFGGSSGLKTPTGVIRAISGWYNRQINTASIKMQALEDSSLASDWRRSNPGQRTPWSDIYTTGIFLGDEQQRQKLYKLPQIWSLDKDEEWIKYLNLLARAKLEYPQSVTEDPISGIDWWADVFKPYSLMLEGGTTGSESNVIVPKKKKKGRT